MTSFSHQALIPITRRRAWALMLLGPADSWDNPLNGTRFDSVLRQRRDLQKSITRRIRREQRHSRRVIANDHACHDE